MWLLLVVAEAAGTAEAAVVQAATAPASAVKTLAAEHPQNLHLSWSLAPTRSLSVVVVLARLVERPAVQTHPFQPLLQLVAVAVAVLATQTRMVVMAVLVEGQAKRQALWVLSETEQQIRVTLVVRVPLTM